MTFNSFNQAIQIAKWWCPRVKNLLAATVASTMVSLWRLRNNILFDNKQLDINKCSSKRNPPGPQVIKLNTDVAARGNPGPAGIRVCFRDHFGTFKFSLWRSIGINTNNIIECLTILEGTELAIANNWLRIWIESDFMAAVIAFESHQLPWDIAPRWTICHKKLLLIKITHIWREGNILVYGK
ncbi:hypothetical protein IFM89_025760, partial [Coptis chinensis]